MRNVEFAIADVETTGIHPRRNHKIVEISVRRIDCEGNLIREFSSIVNPNRDPGPQHIHGLSSKVLSLAPEFPDVAGGVLECLRGAVFVAHNAAFDKRFIRGAFSEINKPLPTFPIVCTLSLASKLFPEIKKRSLSCCCETLGIQQDSAHEASADVMATSELLLRCIKRMRSSDSWFEEAGLDLSLPSITDWPELESTGQSLTRTEAEVQRKVPSGFWSRITENLPAHSDFGPGPQDYYDLLVRVMEDRIITDTEIDDLIQLAKGLSLSSADTDIVHRKYLEDVVVAAWDDGVLTDVECNDITEVARALEISDEDTQLLINECRDNGPAFEEEEEVTRGAAESLEGKTVCFTGQFLCKISDERITKKQAAELAAERGLVVAKSVTKKLDILVVADPHSMSNKAKKARDYGTRIIAEKVFWELLQIDAT